MASLGRNYKIFCEVVVRGRTYENVGNEFGLSRERVRQIIWRDVRRVRKELNLPPDIDTHSVAGMRQNAALIAGAVYQRHVEGGLQVPEDIDAYALRTGRGTHK